MFQNYLKTAFRHLLKRKSYAFINIFGLAVGIACCLIICLYILEELSFDRFHEKADRIYRTTTHAVIGDSEWKTAVVSPALGPVLTEEIPEIEKAVRIDHFENVVVRFEDQVFTENEVLAADPDFFQVFTFPLLEGDPNTALAEPYTIAITRAIAEKYFRQIDGVIGRYLTIDDQAYEVKGVLDDIPENTHFYFDMVFSFHSLRKGREPRWQNSNTITYFLLQEGASIEGMQTKLEALLEKHSPSYNDMIKAGYSWNLPVQAMRDVHLRSHLEDELQVNGHLRNVYIFALIALFILLIACINFMNMATARSADRAREVGVRKTLGSRRSDLIRQFLTESGLITLLALLLSLGLTELMRRPFSLLSGRSLNMELFSNPLLLASLFLIAIFVTLAAGSYPAFYLSRFQPISVLRGVFKAGSKSGGFRNALVVFQFVVSISLIACTILVYQQLRFIQNKELGMNKENVLIIQNADKLGEQQNSFLERLQKDPRVQAVAFSNYSPFAEYEGSYFVEKGRSADERQLLNFLRINENYLPTMGISLKEGRNFSKEFAADTAAIILNEAAVEELGMNNPIDKFVLWSQPLRVVGVVNNYHFRSLHEDIRPLALLLAEQGDVLEVRLSTDDVGNTLAWIEKEWQAFSGASAPLEYSFLDEDFNALFQAEQRQGKLFGAFALLAIFIACLGLLALASFMAERRSKEMGIRKILGASTRGVLFLLSRDFTRLVLIAFVIASPLAWWLMNQWLQSFAYRIDINWTAFALAGLAALIIAWITVSLQSFRVATSNPVEALRDE